MRDRDVITGRHMRGLALLLVLFGACATPSGGPSAGPATGAQRVAPSAARSALGTHATWRVPPRGAVTRPLMVAERAGETLGVAPPAGVAASIEPAPSSPGSRPTPHDWLETTAGDVRTPIGLYRDCQGLQPLTHGAAAIDVCITDRTYFVGHNPGVFTPLLVLGVGSTLLWFDHAGTAHPLRVVAVRVWRGSDFPPVVARGIAAQFQTCIDVGGSLRRILDAVSG